MGRHRAKSGRGRRPLRYIALAGFVLAGVVLLGAVLLKPGPESFPTRFSREQSRAGALRSASPAPMPAPSADLLPRRVYPFSVIPGGARSAGELKQAMTSDRVVAKHYAGFRLARARAVQMNTEKSAYVSYRMNGEVYWAKKRIRLVKGEALLTDGENYARARCGNRISEKPQPKTSPNEPRRELLEYDPVGDLAGPQANPSPETVALASSTLSELVVKPPLAIFLPRTGGSNPPDVPIIIGGGFGTGSGGTPPTGGGPPLITPVPEPGSLLLLTSGLAAVWALRNTLRE